MNCLTQHRDAKNSIGRKLERVALVLAIAALPSIASTAQAQTFTTLYSFTGGADGGNPSSTLLRDAKGNLYGTTELGGLPGCYVNSGCGTVFKIDSNGKESVLYSFSGGADGGNPLGGLVRVHGELHGTTPFGGAGGGTVFKLDRAGHETVLHAFLGGSDGASPDTGALVRDKLGNLYGTTIGGGGSMNCQGGCGTVFKVDTAGNESVLYSFTGAGGDGSSPDSRLARDKLGNLYGTTFWGGAHSNGTVFKLDSAGNETVLYSFAGTNGDGNNPLGGVVLGARGSLYGTTTFGGAYGFGTVYKVDSTGTETVLYSFTGLADGGVPRGRLLHAGGVFYGTTNRGGDLQCSGGGCGVVFKIDAAGHETVLHTFTLTDGGYPDEGLTRDKDGNLYGTTNGGGVPACEVGRNGCGTVFRLTP